MAVIKGALADRLAGRVMADREGAGELADAMQRYGPLTPGRRGQRSGRP